MSEAQRSWWLDADRNWRRGAPPDGWRQGSDGRWHAPHHGSEQTTEEVVVVPAPWSDPPPLPTEVMSAGPARPSTAWADEDEDTARHRRPRTASAVSGSPAWLKVAVAALAAVIVVSAAGVLIAASRGTDGGSPSTPDEQADSGPADAPPADDATTATTGATAPDADETPAPGAEPGDEPGAPVTTTAPATTTTAAAPAPADGDPLAACSTGQRKVIERGDHPQEWYVARFDDDGDGILCN